MALDPKYSYAAVNAGQNAVRVLMDLGKLRIYGGSVPANADDAIGGATLLAELTLNGTAFGASSNGTITANAITSDASADASGTATFFRLWNSAGTTCYFQGTVGTSGCDLNLDNTSITVGGPVAVTSLTLTLPRE